MKKRNFLSCLLIIAIVLATISPTVLFAAEDIAQDEQVYDETYTEETEEYVEETPEAYDWTIETNELKKWPEAPGRSRRCNCHGSGYRGISLQQKRRSKTVSGEHHQDHDDAGRPGAHQ